jgi:hypothetical protein
MIRAAIESVKRDPRNPFLVGCLRRIALEKNTPEDIKRAIDEIPRGADEASPPEQE